MVVICTACEASVARYRMIGKIFSGEQQMYCRQCFSNIGGEAEPIDQTPLSESMEKLFTHIRNLEERVEYLEARL